MRPPGRPVGDLRTPVAWRQREYNLNHNQLQEQEQLGQLEQPHHLPNNINHNHHPHHHHHHEEQLQWRRGRELVSSVSPPVSSTDEGGADGDESSELDTSVSGQRLQRRNQQQQQQHQQLLQQRLRQRQNRISQSHYAVIKSQTMTMRSTRSVPALERSSWPNTRAVNCPVHGNYTMQPGPNPRHHQQHPSSAFPLLFVGKAGNGPMRRAGSMFDMRQTGDHMQLSPHSYPRTSPMCGSLMRSVPIGYGPTPLPPLFCTLEKGKKSSHYGSVRSLHSLHPMGGGPVPSAVLPITPLTRPPMPPPYNLPPMPPLHLLPPGMRPRPLVIPATVEPLPMRDPAKPKMINGLPALTSSKGEKALEVSGRGGGDGKRRCHCCRGPILPLIWFIVCTVTVGVIVGVILGSIYG